MGVSVHEQSTPTSLFLIRVVLYGGSSVLAGFVWAWAFGANLWYGVVPGAAVGVMAVVVFGSTSDAEETGGLESVGYFLGRMMVVALLLALSMVGAIVGVIIRLVS